MLLTDNAWIIAPAAVGLYQIKKERCFYPTHNWAGITFSTPTSLHASNHPPLKGVQEGDGKGEWEDRHLLLAANTLQKRSRHKKKEKKFGKK